jgi:hypothetical protein
MNAKVFLFFIFVLVCSCATTKNLSAHELSVDPQITADVRRVEMEIAHLFEYSKWPLAPTKVAYNANCHSPVSFHSGGTIILSCDTPKYREGKPFMKKNVSGKMEKFPGYTDYLDTLVHEVAHNFSVLFIDSRDAHWKECDADEYFELSEGFATYVAYQILLREAKSTGDYQYERYLAARTARYSAQLARLSQKKSQGKSLALKDENSVESWYPRGLARVYALRQIFTKENFKNGTIKKYFCGK